MKGKSTKKSRFALAKYLNEHLCSFGDGLGDMVICPTCVKELNLNLDHLSFTAGHIMPKASGGDQWTFLCKDCNSQFGEKQDKWLGEYLNILNNPKGTFLNAKTKSRYIGINGETLRGNVEVSNIDEAIEVFLPINGNAPGKIESIKMGKTLEVSFKPELIHHENEIEVGYITAAYLTWFHEVGYNWVLQSSLDNVRKQILNCNRDIDGAKVIDLGVDKLEIQGIGIIIQSGALYPCCVITDRLVVFPTPSTVDAPTPKSVKFESPCDIHFLKLAVMSFPYLTVYGGYHVVVPDRLRKCPPIPDWVFYIHPEEEKVSEWLAIAREDLS